jgi:hypothetical protein
MRIAAAPSTGNGRRGRGDLLRRVVRVFGATTAGAVALACAVGAGVKATGDAVRGRDETLHAMLARASTAPATMKSRRCMGTARFMVSSSLRSTSLFQRKQRD